VNLTKELIGTINLGYHAVKGDYVVLLCRSGVMVEPIVNISGEEMKSNGVSMILKFLRNRPKKATKEMSAFDKAQNRSLLKIKQKYALITMSVLRVGEVQELEIIPLHAGRGWSFERRSEEICRARLPITNEQFLKMIGDAFEVAT
jgi:hypothetical protein